MSYRFFCGLVLFCCGSILADSDSLIWDQFDSKVKVDVGQIVNGFYVREVELQPVNRNTLVLSQSAKYGDAWEFATGFEAILWWPFGQSDLGLDPPLRSMRVEPRLSQAKAKFNLYTEADRVYVEFGFFPYKYNPDASNLGEYLYRSGTYPGVLQTTDGLHLLDHALYEAYGVHFHSSLMNGLITQEINFFSEPNIYPIGDITPGYELSFTSELFRMGVGAAYNRLISSHPGKARPDASTDADNKYIEVDSAGKAIFKGPYSIAPYKMQHADTPSYSVYASYYTQRGLKLMARASLDLGFLLPENIRGAKDLRVFTEAAVLGVESQPYYYDDIWQRIPVMAGVNLPTFKILDLLSLQTEYYGSLFNNTRLYITSGYPVWDPAAPHHKHDDWKWSLYAEKNIGKLFKVHVQIANDHLRLTEFDLKPNETDITVEPGHWYYVVRLEFGG